MTATGSAQLAAAVSNAGGLGMLTCLHCRTPERLDEEIAKCRSMTSKPFGCNLTILGEKRGEPEFPEGFVSVIVQNKIEIVETCGGGIPLMKKLHEMLRAGGVKVIISKCVQVKHAITAQNELGSDAVALMGYDSGGLPGEVDVGMFVQLAAAKKALRIPFLASGGVATGSQLIAALSLGAAGVQIGTAFNCTTDNNMFPESFKKRMVAAGVKDTAIVMRPFRASSRVYLNQDAKEVLKIEKELGANIKFTDVANLVKFERLREGMDRGDADRGIWNCGSNVVLLDSIPSCEELVQRIIKEARETLDNLSRL